MHWRITGSQDRRTERRSQNQKKKKKHSTDKTRLVLHKVRRESTEDTYKEVQYEGKVQKKGGKNKQEVQIKGREKEVTNKINQNKYFEKQLNLAYGL